MAQLTKIEWCHHTFNPWIGCTKVSPGCAHCYAEAQAKFRGWAKWGDSGTRKMMSEAYWAEPRKWDRAARDAGERHRVFSASLADVFEDRPELVAPRVRLFHLINDTPHLDWLLLTKRPENIRRFLGDGDTARSWAEPMPANVWAMTSIESADHLGRIDNLKGSGARVLGLSIEPLLGPMPTLGEYLDGIDWVIVGGESGPGARPMHPAWARGVRDQCVAAEVPFFMKQWGEWFPVSHPHDADELVRAANTYFPRGRWLDIDGSYIHKTWETVMMDRVGKKAAGRVLDGRTWWPSPLRESIISGPH